MTGTHYVCTKDVQLYTQAGYSSKAYTNLMEEGEALKLAGKPHSRVWLTDSDDSSFYLIDEPGDDKFDAVLGTGICSDTHIDYMNTGCFDPNGAKFTMSVTGCTGRAFGWATIFCGSIVDYDEDFVSDVSVSFSSMGYPRVLQEEAQHNGKTLLRMTCGDPFDCQRKCEALEKRSRDGGLPAPLACALCNPPCPDNPGTSLVDTVHAFADDVASALTLAAICLNPTACVCQIFMLIKPAWIDNLPDSVAQCKVGDIFSMLLDQIGHSLTEFAEFAINHHPIYMLARKVAKFAFIDIPKVCLDYTAYDGKKLKECPNPDESTDELLGCSAAMERRVHKQCYYERRKSICMAEEPHKPTNPPLRPIKTHKIS